MGNSRDGRVQSTGRLDPCPSAPAAGPSAPGTAFTQLLRRAAESKDPSALIPVVYEELRAIARRQLRSERFGHTLQPTALVHEAYAKLFGGAGRDVAWNDRSHFFNAAAQAMRHVLLEHARSRGRLKRGGKRRRVPLESAERALEEDPSNILMVDEAIRRLEREDPDLARVVHLRFYGGLGAAETAAMLGVSESTLRRDWKLARAWLARELGAASGAE